MLRPFKQVDVFGSTPLSGNPLAVVLDGNGLSTDEMQRFARWTNLSETTFLIAPDADGADYRVRIFTPGEELPFAGHPTLGTCHAWLEAGHTPRQPGRVVQQCGAGLITIKSEGGLLGFAAPPLMRSGPVDEELTSELARQLGIGRDAIVDAQWADNGPGWIAVLLDSADAVLAIKPDLVRRDLGIAGPYPAGSECAFEVRAFFPAGDRMFEDPVTGSLNASLAQWLLSSGRATAPYVASQGTVLGRRGRVHIDTDAYGTVWVSGATATTLDGTADL
jgi:PhzF family phenazine biosynthesis protein